MPDEPIVPGKDLDEYDAPNTGTEMYYRVPNGEVTIGRIGKDESEKEKRKKEKWVPLEEYGSFKIQPYHMDHPFEVLFQRGGAKELSPRQVIDQGFYYRPPLVPRCKATVGESYKNTDGRAGHLGGLPTNTKHTDRCWVGAKPAVFPQLETTPAGPFACKWCSDETGEERLFARAVGLRQHESVMHSDEIGGDRLGQQLIQGLGHMRPSTQDLDLKGELLKAQEEIEALKAAAIVAPIVEAAVQAAITCDECGKSFASPFGLQGHKRSHAKEPAVA